MEKKVDKEMIFAVSLWVWFLGIGVLSGCLVVCSLLKFYSDLKRLWRMLIRD